MSLRPLALLMLGTAAPAVAQWPAPSPQPGRTLALESALRQLGPSISNQVPGEDGVVWVLVNERDQLLASRTLVGVRPRAQSLTDLARAFPGWSPPQGVRTEVAHYPAGAFHPVP
jgi:hypothetical protein